MEAVSLIADLSLALVAALIGGTLAGRLGLPALLGYMLAGMVVSPFSLGLHANVETINLFAEIGVVLLMFGVGVDFSLKQLRSVQQVAVFGGGGQLMLTIGLGIAVGMLLGWPWGWQLFFGCALALSSTTVLLKILMDRGELGSQHGQIAIGISLVQDLSTIVMMAVLPALTVPQTESNPLLQIGWSLLQTLIFLGLMLILGTRLFPLILMRIARHTSRELFLLAVIVLSLGTAFVATSLFGLSLALGAFVAGLVVSESDIHYRILGEVLPIRDMFAVLFFVSVGMLIDPRFIWQQLGMVLLISTIIIGGKFSIGVAALWWFPYDRRTILATAASLAQIGEFSFILAELGRRLNVIDNTLYRLILSGALLSSLATPFLLRGIGPLTAWLDRHVPSRQRRAAAALPEVPPDITGHAVICGYGQVGMHIAEALHELGYRHVIIDQDWRKVQRARDQGALPIYGDATQSAVLNGAHLDRACVVVVTLPDPALQRLVIQQIRAVCRDKPIIARAETMDDLPYLYEDGAHDVILPEFEGGLAMLRQALLRFDVATETIQNYIDMIHAGRYEPWHKTDTRSQLLSMLRRASSGLYPQWYQLAPDSVHEQRTINALNIRQQTGASVVAIVRDSKFLVNPEADTTLQRGDRLAVLGNEDQRRQFVEWLSDGEPGSVVPASPAVLHDAHEQNR